MTASDALLPVELSGGPLDGHRTAVPMPEIVSLDVQLFSHTRSDEDTRQDVIERSAYRWTGRTTGKGKRWVLEFSCIVSRQFRNA